MVRNQQSIFRYFLSMSIHDIHHCNGLRILASWASFPQSKMTFEWFWDHAPDPTLHQETTNIKGDLALIIPRSNGVKCLKLLHKCAHHLSSFNSCKLEPNPFLMSRLIGVLRWRISIIYIFTLQNRNNSFHNSWRCLIKMGEHQWRIYNLFLSSWIECSKTSKLKVKNGYITPFFLNLAPWPLIVLLVA